MSEPASVRDLGFHRAADLASSPDGFLVRPAEGDDELNFVRKTWLREYGEGAWPAAEFMFGPRYMAEHHRCIDAVLERGAVSVAYRPSTPTRICGFAVTEEAVVHFVFVRGKWRRMGVAKLLLRPLLDSPADYTHRTLTLKALDVPEAWTFNPYPFLRTA